ncbi:hypothetical protein [Actinomadura nitritigenes]|uniref:hypothetical protein n=1 Tax=Actinomadura nitritigenes TaxID=134602 RepID=UPI003D8AD6C0
MAIKIQVLNCGRCGKPRGLTHTCRTRMDSKRKPGKTRLKPRVKITTTCRTCGKPRGLTHTCRIQTDFKKRKAAAARREAAERKRRQAARRKATAAARRKATGRKPAAGASKPSAKATAAPKGTPAKGTGRQGRPAHDYRTCKDTDCTRFACQVWKEAFAEAMAIGLEDGYQQAHQQPQPTPQGRTGGKPRMTQRQIKALVADHFSDDNIREDEVVLMPNGDIVIDRRKYISWAKPHVVGRWKP